ncbi:MAG: AAA family ATPase [Planctomycetes bacterium]|nr:AAA family ATPase [Planctomycetota bacterium]
MAKMIPASPSSFNGSIGEERVFDALKALPEDVTVLYSLRWTHPGPSRARGGDFKPQGEGDFVVVDPRNGVLVIEVKGGDIRCESGQWLQRNRKTGETYEIWPEQQASNTVYRILEELTYRLSSSNRILVGSAVWFPDVELKGTPLPPRCAPETTLDSIALDSASDALGRAFHYWRSVLPGKKAAIADAAEAVVSILAPTFSLVRTFRQSLAEQEDQLVRLTREQTRVVEFLDDQRTAAITGPAGTGKTMLALEKARRLASPKDQVLFLCYNAGLRQHLRNTVNLPNVQFQNFHGLALSVAPDGVSLDEAVDLLLEACEEERLPYQHILIDEAQDYEQHWLEYLEHAVGQGAFYVFYDPHQAIQEDAGVSWLNALPCRLSLSKNCRNTKAIARVAYRTAALRVSDTLGDMGAKPVIHRVEDDAASIRLVESLIERACKVEGVLPEEVAVINLESISEGSPWQRTKLSKWATAEIPTKNHVSLNSVRRFKGLEAAVVILVDVDFAKSVARDWRSRFYVACSRGRHAVHVVTKTKTEDLKEPMVALTGSNKAKGSWTSLAKHLGARLVGRNDDPFNES